MVTKAALLVGGSHGDGVATCRAEDNSWSQIGFLDLIGASFGAQLGAKTTSLVLFFTDDNAQEKLSEGEVSLGATLSYVLWDEAAAVDIVDEGIVAYSGEAGVFAGAALDGVVIRADAEELEQFYRNKVGFKTVLNSVTVAYEPKVVDEFIAVLQEEPMSKHKALSEGDEEKQAEG